MFETTMQFLGALDRPPTYFRVLMACLATMDPTQFRRVTVSDLCRFSGIAPASGHRAMAMLLADRVIIKRGATSSTAYRLNNNLVSMSTADKWAKLERDPEVIDARGR